MTPPRRATLTDVASQAGVSLKTASRVINGVSTVAPGLRDQVLTAARALGYRPHRGAATMRSGTSDMVGMVIRDMGNPFYSRLAAGAAEIAGQYGCLLITCSSEGSPDRERKLLEAVFAQRPRGVILTPTPKPSQLIAAEIALGCPVVAIDEPLPELVVDSVVLDNYAASYKGVSTALDLGRRRFAMITDDDSLATMEPRARGAVDALAERNLSIDSNLEIRDVHTDEQARAAAARLLTVDEPPDVIFCANNVAAIGAASEIHSRGLDVALVAFDAFPLSQTLPQPVIVLEHDDREMGRAAARLLFDRLADPHRPAQTVSMRTHLRVF